MTQSHLIFRSTEDPHKVFFRDASPHTQTHNWNTVDSDLTTSSLMWSFILRLSNSDSFGGVPFVMVGRIIIYLYRSDSTPVGAEISNELLLRTSERDWARGHTTFSTGVLTNAFGAKTSKFFDCTFVGVRWAGYNIYLVRIQVERTKR